MARFKDDTLSNNVVQPSPAQSGEISVFPNPASSKLYLASSTAIQHFKIIDALGREIRREAQWDANEYAIDVSDLPNGIYYLIADGIVRKFIISR